MASGEIGRLRPECEALVLRGASSADLREAAYVAALFCGFPRGVAALREMAHLQPTDGLHRLAPDPSRASLRATGERVFRTIHLANADRQLEMLAGLDPDFADTVLV